MITYRKTQFGITVPELHTVKLHWKQKSGDYMILYKWCKENCKSKFYPWPNWMGNGYQFEDDEDAALFALRWS